MNLTEQQKMQQRQSLPLEQKIQMTEARIKAWFDYWDGDVYLALSGGKDSQVVAEILWRMGGKYRKVPMVFSNTGLEMPEIVKHVRSLASRGFNIVEIKPKMNFRDVWQKEGIPLVSKKVARQIRTLKKGPKGQENTYKLYDEGITSGGHKAPSWKLAKKWRHLVENDDIKTSEKCCDRLKKEPIATYEKATGLKGRGITGMMASEGGYRAGMTQCNTFEGKTTRSSPILFWSDSDVFEYIEKYNVEICSVYYNRGYADGELVACDSPFVDLPTVTEITSGTTLKINVVSLKGEHRTGCMFCAFGAHLEKGSNRFQRMSISHPRQHALIMDRIGMRGPLELINVKVDFNE